MFGCWGHGHTIHGNNFLPKSCRVPYLTGCWYVSWRCIATSSTSCKCLIYKLLLPNREQKLKKTVGKNKAYTKPLKLISGREWKKKKENWLQIRLKINKHQILPGKIPRYGL